MNGEIVPVPNTIENETDLATTAAASARSKARIFVLYEDFASGIPARWLAGEIARLAKPLGDSTIEMWKFDHVTRTGAFQKMTAQEAGEADVLIIAAVSVNELPHGLLDWFNLVASWKKNRLSPTLIAGLLGIQGEPTETDFVPSVMSDELARFAQRTESKFVWRWMNVYGEADSTWLREPVQQWLALQKQLSTGATPTLVG